METDTSRRKVRVVTATRRSGPHPTTVLLRLSVLVGAVGGFGTGLALLLALAVGQANRLPFDALAQAHGQVQVLGFVGLFILGTAGQLLPGFLATPLRRRRPLIWGGYAVAGALLLREIAQPLGPGWPRNLALGVAAIGELGGVALCLASYRDLLARTLQPAQLWRQLALGGFAFLVAALGLNLVATAFLIGGSVVVPAALDGAVVDLELWGFALFVTLAVGRKVLPRFLLLPDPDDRLVELGAGVLVVSTLLLGGLGVVETFVPSEGFGWLARLAGAWLRLAGVAVVLHALRLYRPAVRPSGAPTVTEPARRWLHVTFGWLVVASGLGTLAASVSGLRGVDPGYFAVGAERHALGQGFLLTLIVALGARLLPGFSAWAIQHPRALTWLVSTITLGAAVRVVGEIMLAGRAPVGASVAAVGGALGVVAFLAFGAILFVTVGRVPRPGRG
jgi:hypothetical protein